MGRFGVTLSDKKGGLFQLNQAQKTKPLRFTPSLRDLLAQLRELLVQVAWPCSDALQLKVIPKLSLPADGLNYSNVDARSLQPNPLLLMFFFSKFLPLDGL